MRRAFLHVHCGARWLGCLRPEDWTAVCVSAAIFVYLVLRVVSVPITIDEALSWTWHVSGDWVRIALMQTDGLPDNNHVLFSLLSKLSVTAFGLSEFALRLPTLVGASLFLLAINVLLKRMTAGWMQPLGVAVIALNPYLVDFFTVARGYGLALGLSMLGLVFVSTSIGDASRDAALRAGRIGVLCFALAALAHLSFLLAAVAVIPILTVKWQGRASSLNSTGWFHSAWAFSWPSIPLFLYLIRPITVIRKAGLFALSEENGFWQVTVASLVRSTVQDPDAAMQTQVLLAWIVLTVFTFLIAMMRVQARQSFVVTVSAIIGVVAITSVLQHHALGVALLEGRRALLFIPLFFLCALSLPVLCKDRSVAIRSAAWITGVLAPIVIAGQALSAANLAYVYDWKFDACSRDVMLKVKESIDTGEEGLDRTLGATWFLGAGANFYREMLGLHGSLREVRWKPGVPFDHTADLFYVVDGDMIAPSFPGNHRVLLKCRVAGTSLILPGAYGE